MTNREGKVETVTNFILGSSKITVDGDFILEIIRCLLLGRKSMIKPNSILKSEDSTLLTKVHIAKTVVFELLMYECECWTIKEAEC